MRLFGQNMAIFDETDFQGGPSQKVFLEQSMFHEGSTAKCVLSKNAIF